jgi:lysophospholipase L1-like esterase
MFMARDARRGIGAVWVAVLLVLAVSTASPSARADTPELRHCAARLAEGKPLLVVAFGSSSTEGVGASDPSHAYPQRLANLLAARLPVAVTVHNEGIGGQDADDMLPRLLRQVIPEHPTLVIWQTGSNDPLRHVPVGRFTAETRAGLVALRAAGIDAMLMEPQMSRVLNDAGGTQAYRDALRALGREFGVHVIARYDLMQHWLATGAVPASALMSPDGLHMGDAGYAALAENVASEVSQGMGVAAVTVVATGPARKIRRPAQ